MKLTILKKVTDTDCSNTIDFLVFLANIREGVYEDAINKVRNAKTKEEKTAAKKQLPAVTVSGLFSQRKDSGLTEHSGLLAIDFDNISYEQAKPLRNDQYTYAGFVSASGYGYCVIVKVNPKKHRDSFIQLADYYMKTYGLIADSSCINESRLRFVSYDPNVVFNSNAAFFKVTTADAQETKERKATGGYVPYLASDFDEAVSYICGNGIDITDSYNNWLHLAFALASEFGENGRHYFHQISSISTKYSHEVADKKYSNALVTNRGRVGIGTFFYLCKSHGVPINLSKAHKIAKTGAVTKKAKGTIEGAYKQFEVVEGRQANEDERKIIEQAYNEPDSINLGDEKPNRFDLARQYLTNNHYIWIEEFSGKIYDGDKIITDRQINSIWEDMNKSNIAVKTTELINMMESNHTQERNPIDEQFKRMSEKYRAYKSAGGSNPLDELFKHLHTASPEDDKAMFRLWMLNVIQSFYKHSEGYFLMLLGKGNLGKTFLLRQLMPECLKPYFSEPELTGTKDDYEMMCSYLIIFQDEVIDKGISDHNKFKRMMSRTHVTYRKPYGRGSLTRKTISSFCGTSNEMQIMPAEDNRRYLPIEFTGRANIDGIKLMDMELIWGYICDLYFEGVTAQMTPEQVDYLNVVVSEKYKEDDMIAELVLRCFYPAAECDDPYAAVSTTEVYFTFPTTAQNKCTLKQVGSKLIKMGYERRGTSNKWKIKRRGN